MYFMSNGYRVKFKTCQHDWGLLVDIQNCGGPAAGNGIFLCENCGTSVSFVEKCALEQTDAQKKSLLIQQRHTKISMWAIIVAAATVIIAFFNLLFGDKLVTPTKEKFTPANTGYPIRELKK